MCWRGHWLQFEKMPVELVPRRLQPLRSMASAACVNFIPGRFHYISYAQLVQDCREFARSLPAVRAIAGVPRSGLIPATLIALELNVPMVALEMLIEREDPGRFEKPAYESNLELPAQNGGPVIALPRRGFHNRRQDGVNCGPISPKLVDDAVPAFRFKTLKNCH